MITASIIRHRSHYYETRGQVTRVRKSKRVFTHALVGAGPNGSADIHYAMSEANARKAMSKYPKHELVAVREVSLDDFR